MKKLLTIIATLMLSLNANALPAMSAPADAGQAVQVEKQEKSVSILKPIKVQVLKWNMWINKQIPKYMKSLKNNPSIIVILTALFAAFVYGILHTLGPGHGKMVVATYFLTQEAKFLQGVWLGVKTAFAHVGGAIVLILTTDIALRSVILDPETNMYLLRNISFSLIILVGSVMLIQAILHATGKVKNTGCAHCNHAAHAHAHKHDHHHHDHSHDHSHSHDHHHDHSHKHKHNKKETFIALSIGAIPCTGSLLILLYAMANDILYFGLLMVVFVALGMALTMIVLGLVTILGKKKLIDKIFNTTRHAHKGKIVLELAGALFIIAIGSLLLWVNL